MDDLERRAEEAEDRGDFASALKLRRQLVQRDRDPVSLTRYGRVAQELSRWEEAERAFAEALTVDPGFAVAMVCMGDLWVRRTDKNEVQSFEVAKRWLLRALSRERNPHTLALLGATHKALGEGEAARAAFEEVLQMDPEYEDALYNLGEMDTTTDPRRSVELLERLIQISPDSARNHQALGRQYQRVKDVVRAEYHFRRSLEIDPMDLWSVLYLANALAVQGRLGEAEHHYRLAVALHPDSQEAAEFCADFLESIDKRQDAAKLRRGSE